MRLFKVLFIHLLVFFICLVAWADEIAIPSTVSLDTIHPSIGISIAENIAEELSGADQIEVQDHTQVDQVLHEHDFEPSDLLNDASAKKAGKVLEADYLCVSQVSRKELSYIISAKIIHVQTGRIVSQALAKEDGSSTTIPELSSRVGKQLVEELRVYHLKYPSSYTAAAQIAERTSPFSETADENKQNRSHIILSWLIPRFTGSAIDVIKGEYTAPYSYDLPSNGLNLHLLLDMTNYFYFSTSIGYAWQGSEGADSYKAEDFSVLDIDLSGGMLLPFSAFSSFYLGGGLNYVIFTLKDTWEHGEGWMIEGLGISFEGGIDLYIDNLCLSARIDYTYIPQLTTDEFFTDPENLNISSIMFGAGFCF